MFIFEKMSTKYPTFSTQFVFQFSFHMRMISHGVKAARSACESNHWDDFFSLRELLYFSVQHEFFLCVLLILSHGTFKGNEFKGQDITQLFVFTVSLKTCLCETGIFFPTELMWWGLQWLPVKSVPLTCFMWRCQQFYTPLFICHRCNVSTVKTANNLSA